MAPRWNGMERHGRMRTITRLIRRIGICTAAVVTTLGMTGAPVNAATVIYAGSFYVIRTAPCTFQVEMGAFLPMSQEDAEGYLYWGARVEYRIYGQDTWFDDFLYGPITVGTTFHYHNDAQSDGVSSHTIAVLGCSDLNEDLADIDEIYYQAKWVDADGGTIQANSAVLRGEFHR
jgi:hypothetical protein